MVNPPAPPLDWYSTLTRVLARARARWPTVLLYALVGAAAAWGASHLRPSVYRSGAAVLVASRGGYTVPGIQTNAQLVSDLLTEDTVLSRVARGAGSPPTTIEALRRALSVDLSLRTAIIRFTVDAPTAALAQTRAESTLAALRDITAAVWQSRGDAAQAVIGQRTAHAREELRAAERGLAGPHPAKQDADLRSERDAAREVYVQLRVQEELAAAEEAHNAPILNVLETPGLPTTPARPHPRTALLAGLLLGALVALGRFLLESSR
jgi:uncharacterized protein involved in exopolysaccharide biosynthesis